MGPGVVECAQEALASPHFTLNCVPWGLRNEPLNTEKHPDSEDR